MVLSNTFDFVHGTPNSKSTMNRRYPTGMQIYGMKPKIEKARVDN